eukprot:1154203-Pelagomonas_calceolata.AAC.9
MSSRPAKLRAGTCVQPLGAGFAGLGLALPACHLWGLLEAAWMAGGRAKESHLQWLLLGTGEAAQRLVVLASVHEEGKEEEEEEEGHEGRQKVVFCVAGGGAVPNAGQAQFMDQPSPAWLIVLACAGAVASDGPVQWLSPVVGLCRDISLRWACAEVRGLW